jgi:hypothetical protein
MIETYNRIFLTIQKHCTWLSLFATMPIIFYVQVIALFSALRNILEVMNTGKVAPYKPHNYSCTRNYHPALQPSILLSSLDDTTLLKVIRLQISQSTNHQQIKIDLSDKMAGGNAHKW